MKTKDGRLEWSWWWAMSHDVERNDVTRFHNAQECRGSWHSALDPDMNIVEKFMTEQALRALHCGCGDAVCQRVPRSESGQRLRQRPFGPLRMRG